MFRCEADVRKLVAKCAGERVFWVEHAGGGTQGMPDCFVVTAEEWLQPIELKVATLVDGLWPLLKRPGNVRPSQIGNARRMLKFGVRTLFLVGILGTEEVGWAWAEEVLKAIEGPQCLELVRTEAGRDVPNVLVSSGKMGRTKKAIIPV